MKETKKYNLNVLPPNPFCKNIYIQIIKVIEHLQNNIPIGKKEFLKGIEALFCAPATCP